MIHSKGQYEDLSRIHATICNAIDLVYRRSALYDTNWVNRKIDAEAEAILDTYGCVNDDALTACVRAAATICDQLNAN